MGGDEIARAAACEREADAQRIAPLWRGAATRCDGQRSRTGARDKEVLTICWTSTLYCAKSDSSLP